MRLTEDDLRDLLDDAAQHAPVSPPERYLATPSDFREGRRRRRIRLSRTRWAAVGVTVTCGSVAAITGVLLAGARGTPVRTGPPSVAATAPIASPTPTPSPSTKTLPSAPPGPDDSSALAQAQWFTVTESSTQHARTVWYSRYGDSYLDQKDAPASLGIATWGENLLTWNQVQALPTDSVALAKLIRSPGGDSPSYQLFDGALQILEEAPVDIDQRRALVQVMLADPPVTLVTGTKDSRGRDSFQLVISHHVTAVERIDIDPSTFRVLEETDTSGAYYSSEGPIVDGVPQLHQVYNPPSTYRNTYLSWTYDPPPGH